MMAEIILIALCIAAGAALSLLALLNLWAAADASAFGVSGIFKPWPALGALACFAAAAAFIFT